MPRSNKLLQAFGIPYTALLSVIFGLLLVSFPVGIFVVFESNIGGDINYEFPVTHLALFENTSLYEAPVDLSLGDAFVVLWSFYAIIFTIAILGPKQGFFKSISPLISFGKYDPKSNYMIGVTKWISILILISALITFTQEKFGIVTVPPLGENDLVQFFYVTLAPLIEEVGFRLILLGIPLFALYSRKSSLKYFIKCLWTPNSLDIFDSKKAIFLIVFVGMLFGFSHIAFGDSWSEGKFAQATVGGIILGWVYLKYGFVASLLIHWATNYFVFSYGNFLSQINYVSLEEAFSHSLMSTLEILFLAAGLLSISVLVLARFYSKKESALKI
ncbi:MAG: CPBP family intramembrane metalloprotease [Nitrosopumilus sp.]|uniref:CPBP family intramembrane glutamic endopeptidase n=1 Tax=Nitrosopumilus sp. TaxID=2024843 RepID=UPI00247B4AC2|nr:CPBP family intramembrane glutamic endopeptidase [Nitrosopumilus sp.]MCV0391885.1 CPBP family intramembrane metalloprotease [Nitrosopumilus sp.]